MPAGPGKYDDLATWVREQAQARAVIVMVVGGSKGSGVSVQTDATAMLNLPAVLREIADEMEAAGGSA